MTDTHDLGALLDLAERLADAARDPALRFFRSSGLLIDNKHAATGGFDPVTEADRAVETAIRDILAHERPQDAIFGEEHGRSGGDSGLTWVLDPIDGTRSYMSGLPTWGVLIAVHDGARPIVGVMDQPFTGERYAAASGLGARYARAGAATACAVRPCAELSQAVMMTTDPRIFTAEEAPLYRAVESRVRLARYGADCYAYCLIAAGQIDLVVESGLSAYDVQALIPIIEQAGGVMTDWRGGPCDQGGRVLACGDRRIHAQAMALLAGL